MMVARKPREYDSHRIFANYMTMLDHLHLYLVETKTIVDRDKILKIDIDWKNLGSSDEQRFLVVVLASVCRKFTIDANAFEQYVENGLKLT